MTKLDEVLCLVITYLDILGIISSIPSLTETQSLSDLDFIDLN